MGSGVHVDVLERLVRKHEPSYRAHIVEAILEHEREHANARLRREIMDLELEYAEALRPQRRAAEEEVARSRAKADRLREELSIRSELVSARRQIEDLKASWSWRLTAPLRAAADLWRGRRP